MNANVHADNKTEAGRTTDGFVLPGALLFSIGYTSSRAAIGIAFAAAFLLAGVNLVQRGDVTPAAVLYFGVPIVGIIGAALAR